MTARASLVRREIQGPIGLLTIDRPDRRNALSRGLVADLGDALDDLSVARDLRVLILTGAGSTFSAGMDLKEAAEPFPNDEAERRSIADSKGIADLIRQIHQFPRPTIAALNGDAYGGGAGLALACDLVVAAESAKIGYPEVRRGLVAAIVMQDLVRLVGARQARELLLVAEPIEAAEALAWGLINRVAPAERCLNEAIALAHRIALGGPNALSTTKRLLDEAENRPADLRGPAAVGAAVRVSDEAIEGIAAFLEKRRPKWAASTATAMPTPTPTPTRENP